MDAAANGPPQPPAARRRPSPAARLETVLAKFHLSSLALRDVQVAVHLIGREPLVFLLPARAPPRASVELVVTAKGRLRTCLEPADLGDGPRAAVRDLAWAIYDDLGGAPAEGLHAEPVP